MYIGDYVINTSEIALSINFSHPALVDSHFVGWKW